MRFVELVEHCLDVRTKAGSEWLAVCPWHPDRSPSLSINVLKEVYFCRSCGASGNHKSLAKHADVDDPPIVDPQVIRQRTQTPLVKPVPRKVYPESWLNQFDHEHRYWQERGFSPVTISRFRLGWDAERDCVTVPLRDFHGQLLGVLSRRLDGNRPKYSYPLGFGASKNLFAAHLIRPDTIGTVALCEGPLDAIAMWDAGRPAVAMFGSKLAQAHVQALHRAGIRVVIIATDNDAAGVAAGEYARLMLRGLLVKTVQWPRKEAKDPAELSRSERQVMWKTASWSHMRQNHML